MTMHKVKIIQVFKVVREIIVEVDADNEFAAADQQSISDAPDYADPRWIETRDLMSEECEPE